ncbi:MAG TPA: ABC transporter permease subunit [Allosphingosinicella sp.]|nr:ABC transporter permease subunit [Allosphingosinicella sp.]
MLRILADYHEGIAIGLLTTLELVGIAWVGGILLGTAIGFFASRSVVWDVLVRSSAFFLASIPVIIFLFWVHYPLQTALQIVIPPFVSAALVLTILNVGFVAEIVRIALRNFDPDYVHAGIVCGLSAGQIFRRVQIPIFLRQVIPSLLRAQVAILHMTLFASLISVDEIFRMAQRINAETYKPIEIYTALAILFLAVSIPLNAVASRLERRFHGGLRP